MPRPKYAAHLRALLNLLLFAGIVQQNAGAPIAPTAALVVDREFSSPAPFSAPVTAATQAVTNALSSHYSNDDIEESENNSQEFITQDTSRQDNTYPYVSYSADTNGYPGAETPEESEQSDFQPLATATPPASVEQQDQPLVPPTTLSFANVAPAAGDATSAEGSSAFGGHTATTADDATPPYAAVDDKYVPSKPLNLTVLDVTSTTIAMSWHPPKNQNGAIAGYHVFHIHENQTGVEIVKNTRNAMDSLITFMLPNLKPFTEYRVIVKAFTTKNEGEPSDVVVQRTDVAGPSAPIVVNLTCHSQDSLNIRWRRPQEYYNTIDYYIVKARLVEQDKHRDIRINTSAKELETAMILPNLTTNAEYEVRVAAATLSIINPKKVVLGKYSEAKKISLHPNCEKIQPLLRQSHNDYNLAVLVGIIFSCFGIVLIVMAFFLWSRKCFHAAYYYLDDPPHHPNVPQVDWEAPVKVGGEIRAAVPVNEFAKHVASLHADGDIGFSREYEAIQNECITDDLPCEHSQHPENKRKNRYLNITAYDHSRVHLHPTPGQKKNLDYINANFIDGYQKSRAFIGTQGPLPDTFDCFWRMIWEQRVAIIVMITNLVERGRRKCDMYWPKDGVETYGVIQVKLLDEEVMSTYTVRTLQIKHLKLKKKKQCSAEKTVYQYHYTNWPDHGTPDHPLPVLDFVKKSSAANPDDAGPIVVHCSAGVGRTGTYIVLDAMLKQIQQKQVVNVFGFLRHIRVQRNFLVQTEEQYIFIHDALVEAIASGETNLRAEQINELKNCTPHLEQQYKNIIQFQTKDIHIASAMKPVNSVKNRGAIFPIESSRVHLTPKPGEEGSDYINASWLHGFRRLRDFIVTQHPMAHTVKDFWQMVWDHNAQTIVLLSSLDEINFAQFWPDDTTPIESDYYRVKFLSKMNKSDYVSRDFVIQSIQDDYELNVKMLHCPSWPEMSNPNSIYDFIVDVHERSADYRNGPIVVVDRYGGAQACTFCAISSLAIEMEYCNTASIYQYAKLYHNKRPGVWTSSEDIRLIYNILSFLPRNLHLLERTALRTEFEDVTTATPDLYSKICSNGNITQHNSNSNNLKHNNSNSSNNSHSISQEQTINNTVTTTTNTPTNTTQQATTTATAQQQSQQQQQQQQQPIVNKQSPTHPPKFSSPQSQNISPPPPLPPPQITPITNTFAPPTTSTTNSNSNSDNNISSTLTATNKINSNVNFTNTTNNAATTVDTTTTTTTTLQPQSSPTTIPTTINNATAIGTNNANSTFTSTNGERFSIVNNQQQQQQPQQRCVPHLMHNDRRVLAGGAADANVDVNATTNGHLSPQSQSPSQPQPPTLTSTFDTVAPRLPNAPTATAAMDVADNSMGLDDAIDGLTPLLTNNTSNNCNTATTAYTPLTASSSTSSTNSANGNYNAVHGNGNGTANGNGNGNGNGILLNAKTNRLLTATTTNTPTTTTTTTTAAVTDAQSLDIVG